MEVVSVTTSDLFCDLSLSDHFVSSASKRVMGSVAQDGLWVLVNI